MREGGREGGREEGKDGGRVGEGREGREGGREGRDVRDCKGGVLTVLIIVSRISHYAQRLRALYFIKTRDERLAETRPVIEDIVMACDELMSSQKLRKVLEVVLAFGNIMNRGNRGNAYGFKLSSLNRVIDTKSSADKDMTLLHYVVKTLEAKVHIGP